MNKEELDALIAYLETSPDLVNADKINLIIIKIQERLGRMRDLTPER